MQQDGGNSRGTVFICDVMVMQTGGLQVSGVSAGVVPRRPRSAMPLLTAVFIFLFSMALFPFYTGGDQIAYRGFYEKVSSFGLLDGFIYYQFALTSMEPGYFLLCYFLSGHVGKDVLMSLLNAVLSYYLVSWLIAQRVFGHVISLLLMNFYLLVLFFSAERLKLAILFVLLASSCSGVLRYACLCCSVFSHVQMAVLFASKPFSRMATSFASLFRGRLSFSLLYALGGAAAAAVLLFILRTHIFSKLESYMAMGAGGVGDLIKPLIFTAFTLVYAKHKKIEAAAMQLPVIVAAFLVGGERIVLFSYFIFMLYALQYKRGANFGVYLFSGYFFLRGIVFICDIINNGTGFAETNVG